MDRTIRLVDKKTGTLNYIFQIHFYQAFNCQDKAKIKLTFTVDSYFGSCNVESN
jgi:hypothetical protein